MTSVELAYARLALLAMLLAGIVLGAIWSPLGGATAPSHILRAVLAGTAPTIPQEHL